MQETQAALRWRPASVRRLRRSWRGVRGQCTPRPSRPQKGLLEGVEEQSWYENPDRLCHTTALLILILDSVLGEQTCYTTNHRAEPWNKSIAHSSDRSHN